MPLDDDFRRAMRGAGDLVFLPLGGSGEIGMNLNLYGHAGKWLMVDLGVTFGDPRAPGVEIVMPDPAFIVERRDDLVGLVLTHAHEDHLGAVPYLWPRLQCPVYATAFAAAILRRKLSDVGLAAKVPITEVAPGAKFGIGPFEIEMIYITHSIPEPTALAIRTSAGTVLHTGDWKLDDRPLVGPVTDDAALRRAGDGGVLALVGDSTNALREGHSGSEAEVRAALIELIGRCRQRAIVACFSSNIARLETVAVAAMKHDRHVGLVGRSLWRMYEVARESGLLQDLPPFLDESDASFIPRDKIALVCTGSQGEPRSALARIAADDHPHIALEKGDTVIFSSRVIPGNELAIARLQNGLVRQGVELISEDNLPAGLPGPIHVSGHPRREELAQMYQWIRPRIAVPVHGEARHMQAHAELARSCQVPHAIVPENGMAIRLSEAGPQIVGHAPAGRLALDGEALLPIDGPIFRSRSASQWNGVVVATVVVDRKGRLVGDPRIAAPGLVDPESDREFLDELAAAISETLAKLGPKADDETIEQAARKAIRRAARDLRGKRPATEVHLVRVR
ncbi:MAG TPA: ribonuclease J [Alphaproteobacteria bacterium]|nr:ribonuclease J [Alphaproteobacteria bacterium]